MQSHEYIHIPELHSPHDARTIKRGLDALPGVLSVTVSAQHNAVAVSYDAANTTHSRLIGQIERLGYTTIS